MPSPIGRLGLRILRSIEVGPPRFEHAPFVSIGKLAAAAGTDGIRKGAALSYRKPHPPRPMQAAQPPARRLRLWFQPAARADVRKAEDKCCTTCRNKRQRRHDYHDTRPSARSLARQHPRVEPAQILWGCGEDIASIGADVNRWRAPHADDIPRLWCPDDSVYLILTHHRGTGIAGFGVGRSSSSIPSFTVPFCTWLLMGFFKAIPEDVDMNDGLSRFGAFIKVVMPISIAGKLTAVIFAFTLVTQ
jgi:hypothetical protein